MYAGSKGWVCGVLWETPFDVVHKYTYDRPLKSSEMCDKINTDAGKRGVWAVRSRLLTARSGQMGVRPLWEIINRGLSGTMPSANQRMGTVVDILAFKRLFHQCQENKLKCHCLSSCHLCVAYPSNNHLGHVSLGIHKFATNLQLLQIKKYRTPNVISLRT